jgi:kumamolisin
MAENPPHARARRTEVTGGRLLGAYPSGERFSVSLAVRPRPSETATRAEIARLLPALRPRLGDDDFVAVYGADQEDVDRVVAWVRTAGFEVDDASARRRTVKITGTAAQFAKAFGISLRRYQYQGKTFRVPVGTVKLPSGIVDIVNGVFGLDNRPMLRPGSHRHGRPAMRLIGTGAGVLTALQVAEAYDFPSTLNGTGQTIGIPNFVDPSTNSGYQTADLDAYFSGLQLSTPTVVDYSLPLMA